MGKILAFRRAAERPNASVPRAGMANWLRLAAAQILGVLAIPTRSWQGNTLDALDDHLLRDVGLMRDEHGVVRSPEHRLLVPGPLDVLTRPGAGAMLDVAGRPIPGPRGRRR